MRDAVLVLDADRSSIRFAAFTRGGAGGVACALSGALSDLQRHARFWACDRSGKRLADIDCADEIAPGHPVAIDFLFNWLARHAADLSLRAVGHRLRDDGGLFGVAARLDAATLGGLHALEKGDPAGRAALSLVRLVERRAPTLPQIACFDTAFHAAMPAVARAFDAQTRRAPSAAYRHGLAFADLVERLAELDARAARGRVVAVHVGVTVALCAIAGGRSIAATPDVRWRAPRHGLATPGRWPARRAAGDVLRYRLTREIGSLVAALGGLDAVAFTAEAAGGVNDARLRREVLAGLAWLGLRLDPDRPEGPRLARADSPVAAYLVPVDPARTIARHTFALLASRPALKRRSED